SSVFASQPSEQLKQSINHVLEQIGEFFKIDRSYVFQFSDDGKQMSNTYEKRVCIKINLQAAGKELFDIRLMETF
ncbi:MAG: hypothetical protein SCJ97_11125, partial [Bacillota bacterium]|nr:hypothetical protein [Bacillota bacterium]